MAEIVLTDLSSAFEPITPVTFQLERLETTPRFATITRPNTPSLLVRLRVDMEERGGTIEILIPHTTLEPVRELLLQIFMVYYGVAALDPIRHGIMWPLFREPLFCAWLALTCCCSAYIAEVLRAALGAIPAGQIEAALACGMGRWTRARRVIVPQMVRLALPAYGNELVMLVKSTSLASTITVIDVTGVAQLVIAHSYRTLDVFCLAAAVYLGLTAGLTMLLRRIERSIGEGSPR
jgi:octopine/nopaline transport system permease protein